MLVKDWMSTDVITIESGPLFRSDKSPYGAQLSILPVMEDGQTCRHSHRSRRETRFNLPTRACSIFRT